MSFVSYRYHVIIDSRLYSSRVFKVTKEEFQRRLSAYMEISDIDRIEAFYNSHLYVWYRACGWSMK